MASAQSLVAEEDLLCPVCLGLFTDPVSIACGHNFCFNCIAKYWDLVKDGEFECPVCKDTFEKRPNLRVNVFIAELVKKFKDTSVKVEPPCPSDDAKVLCGSCTEPKVEAVKSCLECVVSFCDTHLAPHHTVPDLMTHRLIDPVDDLDDRSCEEHRKPLVLFCLTDQEFICEDCQGDDHQNHRIMSQEAAAHMLKIQVELDQAQNDQLIQGCQQKMQEIQNSLEVSQNMAAFELSCSQLATTKMVDYIKRSQAELNQVIEENLDRAKDQAMVLLQGLEREILPIKEKKSQLDQLWHPDPFVFLNRYLFVTITQPQVTDWTSITLNGVQFLTLGTMARLEETVTSEVSMLCDPDLKEQWQHAVDVSLDANRTGYYLTVSADRKQVSHGSWRLSTQDDHCLDIRGNKGFHQRRFYFEVQVADKTQWIVGIAKSPIKKRGDIGPSPKNGYWTIQLRNGPEFIANEDEPVNLKVRTTLQKVGVFVDYQQGQVSFYDVGARARIFSFTECNFKEDIFPFLNPGCNDGGKNSAPLILTPVTCGLKLK